MPATGRALSARARACALAAAALGCLLAPGAALGHPEDMTYEEVAAEAGIPLPPEMKLEATESKAHDVARADAALARSFYSRAPAAARLGSSANDRYSLAGGCFALRPQEGAQPFLARAGRAYAAQASPGDAEVFRFQPTDLGSYLLLGEAGRLPSGAGEDVAAAAGPSRSAEWTVTGDEASGYVLTARNGAGLAVGEDGELELDDSGQRFELRAEAECAAFPEIQVNSSGVPNTTTPRFAAAKGTIDLHSHLMAFEAFGKGLHCGRPWHPLGVESALVDCPDHFPQGLGGVAANLLVFQDPLKTHDPGGWPSFTGWPTYQWIFTHEQTYYKWIERTWRGGLRLITLLAVDNSAACMINLHRTENCNEMDAVRRQLRSAKQMQRYIDAQSGGPGKGFFRIVRNPFEARRVINSGKLAVVLGIEVSEPLDCGLRNGVPQAGCNERTIDERLAEMHKAGVRQMEMVNKFDNAFAGVAMDGGFQGPVINTANKITTGEFWEVETCTGPDEDREQITSVPSAAAQLIALLPGGSLQLPAYPPAPHCNVRGLSDLGRHLLRRMIQRKIVFDPDHMSVLARRHALDLMQARDYSGIVSSHSWADDSSYERIMEMGGVVTPMADHADEFDEKWRSQRKLYRQGKGSKRFGFGFGFGDDMNGFGGPRKPTAGSPAEISYPFNSPIDKGVRFSRQQSGTKTYDLNTDGMAHFGQWPDYFEGVREDAGNRVIRDLRGGAESYLRMWERAYGVRGPHKKSRHARLRAVGLEGIGLGLRPNALLRSAGQPAVRSRGWRWQVRGVPRATVGAAFGGKWVQMVATTAPGHHAAGISPGTRVAKLRRSSADRLGGGLWIRGSRKGTSFVYGVANGKVRFIAVGTARATRSARAAARAAGLALRGR